MKHYILPAALFVLPAAATLAAEPAAKDAKAESESPSGTSGELKKLGLGFAVVVDVGKEDRVNDAQIVNGIVRVSSDNNDTIRPMLEMHVF